MKRFLKCYPKSIHIVLPLYDTQTKDNNSATQHKLQYNIGVAMEDNAAQHWWCNTILVVDTISNIYL